MTSNVEEINNNTLIEEKEEKEYEVDEKFMERMNKLDELLTKYEKLKEEEKKEEMKLEIWNAHVRDEIIAVEMKDGAVFVGKTRFPVNTNYTSVEQLKQLFHIDITLANGVPFKYHIGGGSVDLFTSKFKRVFIMTESEVADANQYPNMAPEFIKRLLPRVEM
jgi:dsDNA-binding SOS-regulon protein